MVTIEFKNVHIGEIKDLSLDELSKLLENRNLNSSQLVMIVLTMQNKIQNGETSSHKKSELAKIRGVNYSDLKDKDNFIKLLRASSFSPKDGLKLKYANKTYILYLKIEELNEN